MKFITENDLRAQYKAQPFTTYQPKSGERLTPGARQFLLDRGIDLYSDQKRPPQQSKPAKQPDAAAPSQQLLRLKLEALRLRFLLTTKEVLEGDVFLAQQLTALGRQLSLLVLFVDGKCEVADLYCDPCEGMNDDNFAQPLGDCVEVTEFCMQLENGRQLLLLSALRNDLRIFVCELAALGEASEQIGVLSAKVNQLINRLSQMICTAMGGRVCQKKA